MRTKETIVYQLNELSDEAKQKAIEQYRNQNNEVFWSDEITDSYKAAKEIYERLHNIDGEISGARLYTWIQNNILPEFEKPFFYCTTVDGKPVKTTYLQKYKSEHPKCRRSKIQRSNELENCPLTGVCYDYDFLEPIIEFLKNPDKHTTNENLTIPDVENIWDREIEHQNSDDYISEHLECNEYEFTEDGELS